MDADAGEMLQRIRQFGELDPVELDVLPGEMAVAAVVAARDAQASARSWLRRQRAMRIAMRNM